MEHGARSQECFELLLGGVSPLAYIAERTRLALLQSYVSTQRCAMLGGVLPKKIFKRLLKKEPLKKPLKKG